MKGLAAGGWFSLGAAVVFLAGAAVHVFALGQFERIKGPAGTFTIFVCPPSLGRLDSRQPAGAETRQGASQWSMSYSPISA
jgi:hypothetical protein